MLTRRVFLGATAAAIAGPALWVRLLDGTVGAAPGSYVDDLGPADENGVRLPPGFSSRVLARSGGIVDGTGYVWHEAPDGAGVIRRPGGGWVYVSNSEVSSGGGGVSTLEFAADGRLVGARSILSGTSRNCAGGVTTWGTWLSCEERTLGRVFECDPVAQGSAVERPGLGAFVHEAATVDPVTGSVYLTEDQPDGRLYRFVPATPGDLSTGELFAARIPVPSATMTTRQPASVVWEPTSAGEPDRRSTTSAFDGGEGAWIEGDRLLFTTKGDRRVWSLDLRRHELRVLHDCVATPDTPLNAVDNIVVHHASGDIYVAEDGGDMQLCVLREREEEVSVAAFLQVVGQDGSEITGPAFSPDGQRLYFSSQRGSDGHGIIYEVSGPFSQSNSGLAPHDSLLPARRLDV